MSTDATSGAVGSPADDDLGDDAWEDDSEVDEDLTANLFSDEIEGLDASDWDVDTTQIWGEDGGAAGSGGDLDVFI